MSWLSSVGGMDVDFWRQRVNRVAWTVSAESHVRGTSGCDHVFKYVFEDVIS